MLVKKKIFFCFLLSALVISFCAFTFLHSDKEKDEAISKVFKLAGRQYKEMLSHAKNLSQYPRTAQKGKTQYVPISDWTGGFWPGDLWFLYEYTGDVQWKTAATRWTESLEQNQFNTAHHDLGFMMYCSYGNAYRITKNEKYKDILVQSAKSLATRFNPKVGCIESWNERQAWDGKTMWYYPVIVDNLMNLELLFFASKVTGDPRYKNIAISHADKSMRNQVRKDYSTYHVVNYDTLTGKVLNQQTCQGYADNSTWARGQAWAIYGYTMIYRETNDKKYLATARKLADFFMNHPNMPKDKIPYWDFNVNEAGYMAQWKSAGSSLNYIPRDASAAAIVSSALFELSSYLSQEGKSYKDFAIAILNSLGSPEYLAQPGTNGNFLLKHSVGSMPHGVEIDVPLVYADYYYLEALLRYQKAK